MKNLILIYGNEEYLKDKKKQELLTELKAEGSMSFNSFSDENLDLIEIRRLIDTMPFMDEFRKLLIVNSGLFKTKKNKSDAENADAAEGEAKKAEAGDEPDANIITDSTAAVETFSGIPESTIVIFVETEVSAASPLFKLIKKEGELFKFETVESTKGPSKRAGEQGVRAWAFDRFREAGCKIDGVTLKYLIELTGYNMENLDGEIEKLICYTLNRPSSEKITAKDVDAICSRTVSDRVFAMLEAKLKGNIKAAVTMLEELFYMKTPPMKILFLLVRQYNQALSVKECQGLRMSDAEIMSRAELSDWQLRRMKEQVSGMSLDEIKKRLEGCADMEYRVKRGDMTDRLALELLIIG